MTQARTPAADAYNVLNDVWADSGGDIDMPVDPFAVADRLGVRVYTAILGPNLSGYLEIKTRSRPVIYVNEAHAVVRQRFTVAHEVGHFIDARKRGLLTSYSTFVRDEVATRGTDPDEIYANRFAAALLMPKEEVKRYVDLDWSVPRLAGRFGVSQQSMEWRLQNLGLSGR